MKTKEGHSKSYRINKELLSVYVLLGAFFDLLDKVVGNK
jgi:hypothetical protein